MPIPGLRGLGPADERPGTMGASGLDPLVSRGVSARWTGLTQASPVCVCTAVSGPRRAHVESAVAAAALTRSSAWQRGRHAGTGEDRQGRPVGQMDRENSFPVALGSVDVGRKKQAGQGISLECSMT
jgi:hypothetical protein